MPVLLMSVLGKAEGSTFFEEWDGGCVVLSVFFVFNFSFSWAEFSHVCAMREQRSESCRSVGAVQYLLGWWHYFKAAWQRATYPLDWGEWSQGPNTKLLINQETDMVWGWPFPDVPLWCAVSPGSLGHTHSGKKMCTDNLKVQWGNFSTAGATGSACHPL